LIDAMTFSAPFTSGIDGDRPLCPASPWYIGQPGAAPAVPLAEAAGVWAAGGEVEVAGLADDGAGVAAGAELAAPEQPAARASSTISAPARRRPATPRVRRSTRHLIPTDREPSRGGRLH
jgi:hypothetical protein